MLRSKWISLLLSVAILLLVAGTANSQQIKLSLEEVAQTADLIFIGTVEKQEGRFNDQKSMIFTDLLLKDIQIVNAMERSAQKNSSTIRLTYAGGRVGDISINLSITPTLLVGHRYLIFMSDDGAIYANPIIGGDQGLFEIVKDSIYQREYLLTADKRPIIGINSTTLVTGNRQVSGEQNGTLSSGGDYLPDGLYSQPPTPSSPSDESSTNRPSTSKTAAQVEPLSVEEIINFVTKVLLKLPVKNRMLKLGGQGLFYKSNDGAIEAQEIPLDAKVPNHPPIDSSSSKDLTPESGSGPSILGGAVGACGYQNLNIVMEQVSSSSWPYNINNDCMYAWNRFMDIYRFSNDDGTFGNNSQNEFAGFVSDSTLYSVYGFHWNGALAVTVMYSISGTQCSRITQTDLLWNSTYSWTSDATYAIGNSNVLLLRSINMHELGHVWGLQDGVYTETYDYDVATVMQPYYYYIVEDGYGVHRVDAYLERRQYQNQTGILSTRDVGVESYYASNGLKNSTTDGSNYVPGQSINLYNVTVENMSYSAMSDMRIRFYLSTNRTISTSDYQMGSYWFWSSFPAESYNVGNYTTTIPSTIPAGQYYVGAIVTINGFGTDDYSYNDSTSFYYGPITIGSANTTPAQITSPANGTTFASSTVTFNWSPVSNNTSYYLDLSSSPGSRDIYANYVTGGSTLVSGIPTDGRTIYVKLWSFINGAWLSNDYSYKAFTGSVYEGYHDGVDCDKIYGWAWNKSQPSSSINVNIYDGATLIASNVPANQFRSDLPGNQYHAFNYATPASLKDGLTHSIRVKFSDTGSDLSTTPKSFTSTCSAGNKAAITNPANNSTFTSSTVTFTWNTVAGASQYFLDLNSSPGSRDIYANYVSGGSTTVTGIPVDGRTVYVKLWTNIGGAWLSNDYTYKACSGSCSGGGGSILAQIASPANNSTFTSSTVTFNWNTVAGASQYFLDLSSTPGSRDIYANYVSGGLTTVSAIPTDGRTIYVKLWTNVNGAWLSNDYTYKACSGSCSGGGGGSAQITSPINGSTFASSAVTFNWTTVAGASQYFLDLSSTPGSRDIYANYVSGGVTTVSGIPVDGRTVYVRMWTNIGGSWVYNTYTYTARR